MKIKISKAQWELLKHSQIEQLQPDEIKFFKKLPKHVQENILEEIKAKSPPLSEIKKLITLLRKMEGEAMDKTPAPTVEKLNEVIEQIKINNPLDPVLNYLKDLRQQAIETNQLISEENYSGTQNAINSILDQFKQGKITKQQMEDSLKEFAKNKMKITISKKQWDSMSKYAQGRMNKNQEDADIVKQQKVQKQEEEIKQEKLQIAKTILEQFGGYKFVAMTGAKNLTSIGNGLSFKLPGAGFVHNGINYVKIILNGKDTYNMEFGRIRGTTYKIINTVNNIYFDQLQEIFTQETGLNTHL